MRRLAARSSRLAVSVNGTARLRMRIIADLLLSCFILLAWTCMHRNAARQGLAVPDAVFFLALISMWTVTLLFVTVTPSGGAS